MISSESLEQVEVCSAEVEVSLERKGMKVVEDETIHVCE